MTPEEKLLEMLTWKRPHDSAIEKAFCEKYIIRPNKNVELLGSMGNIVVTVGENSQTLFSCHTDTMHALPGLQTVTYDSVQGLAYKDDGECLGADDTTGVWLMLEMIEAKVPGTYVFHRGEERGCIGSHWLADNMADWLKQFKRAIAFDRKEETSVITKQRGDTCCSSTFARDLASQLGPLWKEDPTGSFTDTACYTHIIPECTNLSVGYYNQHGPEEMQNIDFALNMAVWCINDVDWEHLPTVREAKVELPSWQPYYQPSLGMEDYDLDTFDVEEYETATDAELASLTWRQIEEICLADPEFAAGKLYELLHPERSTPVYVPPDIEARLDEFEDALAGNDQILLDLKSRLEALEQQVPTAQTSLLEGLKNKFALSN